MTNRTETSKRVSGRYMFRVILLALIFAGAGTLILIYEFLPEDEISLGLGDVAPRNILAADQMVYVSDFETSLDREQARNSISTIYTRPDPQVARQQVDRLRKIFDYMETVRADPYASLAEKFEWIDAIPDLTLSDTVIDQILIMNDESWAETRQEAQAILNEVMRSEIKETQVLSSRRQLPAKIALDTPDEQAAVIVAITEDLIKANTFPDIERTEAERQVAVDTVEPVVVTVEKNEMIIPAGQVVTIKDIEALEALGLQEPQSSWVEGFIGSIILMLLTTVIVGVYLYQYSPQTLTDTKRMTLLVLLLLIFIAGERFIIPNSPFVAYLYPIAALSMLVVVLIEAQLGFLLTTMMAFLAGYMATEQTQAVVIYFILGGWTGALALGRSQRISALVLGGVYVALVNTGVIFIFNLPVSEIKLSDVGVSLLEASLIGTLNAIISAGVALFGLVVIANLFRMTTSIQLSDLERPTQPLLRQLLLKAPGTYHHSLMVGNLAQQAAERVGADSLRVRVMAMYHDIGKMQRPYFFIENQPDGMSNVHEKLDPQVSAQIIIGHVVGGLELANKYRLPPVLKDGIAQHHGTSLVRFFYYQALEAAKEKQIQVDEAKFRYPGPKPQTKENGILMLADVTESTVRALKPRAAPEIDEIVRKAIAHHLENGQLDECDLTISDLHKIRTAFVDILQGVHHPRIKYPKEAEEDEDHVEDVKAESSQKQKKEVDKRPKKATDMATPQSLHPVSSSQPARLSPRE